MEELEIAAMTPEEPPSEAIPLDPTILREMEGLQKHACNLADALELTRTKLVEEQLIPNQMGVDLTALCMMIGMRMAQIVPDPLDEDAGGDFLESLEETILMAYERFLPEEEVAQDASEG